jgi:monoterpene epsilon-lactone hydrolase
MPSLQSRILRFFIRRMNILNRTDLSLAELRRIVDSSAVLLRTPMGVTVRSGRVGDVPGEWIVPRSASDDRVLLYFHGGGFLFCSPATHRAMIARLAKAAGTPAFSVDYRLAPEHPFPAALEDCTAAYRGLLRSGIPARRIVVAGDSAGGNLALVLLLALRKAGGEPPAAAVGLSPVTDFTFSGQSSRKKAGIDPIFPAGSSRSLSMEILDGYVGSGDVSNELISPLLGDWHGMPPILLHVGEDEVLLDDSVRLAKRVRASGSRAECVVWDGMWHVFQVFAPFLPEANRSIAQIGAFIREIQQGGKAAGN